jgi:hypothetical protein
MNGDNNLTHEVLYAIDMMEKVGSSKNLNILALVDGDRKASQLYGQEWEDTKLLYITRDQKIEEINSTVLADLGEQNLGEPDTVQHFVKTCLQYPADRYFFFMFSHGRGIIDTHTLEIPGQHKRLSISADDTSRSMMTQQQLHDALKSALGGVRFDMMVFFSCLTNMVEIGYSLRDITRYLIASEDEIRIVNDPPGTFQIRGIPFEEILRGLRQDPHLSATALGRTAVDAFIGQYGQDILLCGEKGAAVRERYPASLSLIDCRYYGKVAGLLDRLAHHLRSDMAHPHRAKPTIRAFGKAINASQRYHSFLNLEYYDLLDFLENLGEDTASAQTKQLCRELVDEITHRLIVYERHTADCRSKGVSIYLSNPHIPENIYQAHHHMYRSCHFSCETGWDEMISVCRRKSLELHSEILLEDCLQAFKDKDLAGFARTNAKIPWALRRDLGRGKYAILYRYMDFLSKLDSRRIPRRDLACLEIILRDFLNGRPHIRIEGILQHVCTLQESEPPQKSLGGSVLQPNPEAF